MARDFDGTAGRLRTTALASLAFPFTMSCWVRPDSVTGGSNKYVVVFGNTGSTTQYTGILIAQATGTLAAVHSNSAASTSSGLAISAGAWSHAAGVFAASNSRQAFLNGTGDTANITNRDNYTKNVFSVGALERSTVSLYTDGLIAEVGIYSAALDQEEINELAAGYSPMMVRPQSLVSYYPLHGRNGAAGNEEDWVGGVNLSQTSSPALADHPRIIYPRRRIWTPKAAAVSGTPTLSALTAINITSTSAQPSLTYTY